MKFKFKCRNCGKPVNNKEKKLPVTIRSKIKDKDGNVKDTIVGYLCLKCSRRMLRKKLQQEQADRKRKGLIK